jgi:hypothetical protein
MSYDEAPYEGGDGMSVADAAEEASNQFVTFSVEGELFAAPMAPVQEIIRVPDLAQVPLAPPSLLGLANPRHGRNRCDTGPGDQSRNPARFRRRPGGQRHRGG